MLAGLQALHARLGLVERAPPRRASSASARASERLTRPSPVAAAVAAASAAAASKAAAAAAATAAAAAAVPARATTSTKPPPRASARVPCADVRANAAPSGARARRAAPAGAAVVASADVDAYRPPAWQREYRPLGGWSPARERPAVAHRVAAPPRDEPPPPPPPPPVQPPGDSPPPQPLSPAPPPSRAGRSRVHWEAQQRPPPPSPAPAMRLPTTPLPPTARFAHALPPPLPPPPGVEAAAVDRATLSQLVSPAVDARGMRFGSPGDERVGALYEALVGRRAARLPGAALAAGAAPSPVSARALAAWKAAAGGSDDDDDDDDDDDGDDGGAAGGGPTARPRLRRSSAWDAPGGGGGGGGAQRAARSGRLSEQLAKDFEFVVSQLDARAHELAFVLTPPFSVSMSARSLRAASRAGASLRERSFFFTCVRLSGRCNERHHARRRANGGGDANAVLQVLQTDAGAALASGQPAAAAASAAGAAAVQFAALWCRDRRTAGRGGGQVELSARPLSFATRDARDGGYRPHQKVHDPAVHLSPLAAASDRLAQRVRLSARPLDCGGRPPRQQRIRPQPRHRLPVSGVHAGGAASLLLRGLARPDELHVRRRWRGVRSRRPQRHGGAAHVVCDQHRRPAVRPPAAQLHQCEQDARGAGAGRLSRAADGP